MAKPDPVEAMLAKPVAARRGILPRGEGGAGAILIDAEPDAILDALVGGPFGAARRDCLADVLAGEVPRPIGKWGTLVRLAGQPWTYFVSWNLDGDWAKTWAAEHGWRTVRFRDDADRTFQHFDGDRTRIDYRYAWSDDVDVPAGYASVTLKHAIAFIGGDDGEVATQAWLDAHADEADALMALGLRLDAYIPQHLCGGDENAMATIGGWDGQPYSDSEPLEELPDEAFERVDIVTFGPPETLETPQADVGLSRALRTGDPRAVREALGDGANPDLMADAKDPPIRFLAWADYPFKEGGDYGKYTDASRERHLEVMRALLDAGADTSGTVAAFVERGQHRDELTVLRQVALLLDAGADPTGRPVLGDALDHLPRSGRPLSPQTPLHLLVALSPRKLDVMRLLVSRGADLTARDERGHTPAEAARARLAELRAKAGDLTAEPAVDVGETPAALDAVASLFGPASKRKQAMASLMDLAKQEERQSDAADQRALVEAIALLDAAERAGSEDRPREPAG